jgi:hypothetical protein
MSTAETVERETPLSRAISLVVTRFFFLSMTRAFP